MNIGEVMEIICPQLGIMRAPYNIMDNTHEIRELRAIMNEAGLDLVMRAPWRRLIKSVTEPAGTTTISLPADARDERPVVLVFNGTTIVPRMGTAAYSMASSIGGLAWNYEGNSVKLTSAPASTTIYYVSKNWLDGTKSIIDDNTNVLYVPAQAFMDSVRVRWLRKQGVPFDTELAEFSANLEQAIRSEAFNGLSV